MIGKSFEKNNQTITLNVLYARKENTYPVDVSIDDSSREKQVILLMISNGERLHYLSVKKNYQHR